MRVEDQEEVIAFLTDPTTHGLEGEVEVIETHISMVFLAGDRAYKLKRAVHLPYADFATPAIRLANCERELALNGATAPELYLGVRRINRGAGRLTFNGPGELVDAVVEMRRFDQEMLFDKMALRGEITAPMIRGLAAEIARAHDLAEVSEGMDGADNIAAVLDINRAGFHESQVFREHEIEAIDQAFRAALERLAPRLDSRARAGAVRRCHGDLHLRNVCLYEDRPRIFDCIEFNEQLATIDVLYDLAFLVMDLWHRGFNGLANQLTNRYLDITGQEDGFALVPFFTALRAQVRAHVTATQAETCAPEDAAALKTAAREYYDLAIEILKPAPARLIALGGLSGSGKSTLAAVLAPELGAPPGARLIESDLARKAMFGVDPETRLPEKAYAAGVSEQVYAAMADRAGGLVAGGCTVIADAVYDRPERRAAIEVAAGEVPFQGVWLEARPELLRQRVEDRRDSASDADLAVLESQLTRDLGQITWTRIPVSGTPHEVLERLRACLGLPRKDGDA